MELDKDIKTETIAFYSLMALIENLGGAIKLSSKEIVKIIQDEKQLIISSDGDNITFEVKDKNED